MVKSNLSDEQNQLVDELVCAHVAQQEYLNVYMYKEGFLDFVELYGEINKKKNIKTEPPKTTIREKV